MCYKLVAEGREIKIGEDPGTGPGITKTLVPHKIKLLLMRLSRGVENGP